MDALWPWLIVAGMGVLHGAHPANGWLWATVRGGQRQSLSKAWLSLWPVALGHVIAIAVMVYAVSRGVLMGGPWAQRIAGLLLLGVAAAHLRHVEGAATGPGLALSAALTSALMATAHGAGLMLVPALVPLCMSGLPAREITAGGSLSLGLAAVVVHLAAMLLTAGGIGSLLQIGARRLRRGGGRYSASWCSLALGAVGVGLMVAA